MSATMRSSAGLDARRKRLLFRSWHRGMREMDYVLGKFANHAIADPGDDRDDDQDHGPGGHPAARV